MKLQILSDVHLEFGRPDFDFPATAPYLALLGDIGDPWTETYRKFLLRQAERFELVYVLCGNHEPYKRTNNQANEMVRNICKKIPDKLIHLDMTRHDFSKDIVVLGCTLWSRVSETQRPTVGCFLADYRYIKDWSVSMNNATHTRHVDWLEQNIEAAGRENKSVIILTHHAPTFKGTCAPMHRQSPLSSAFATDLEYLMKPPVVAWASGHTHWSYEQVINGVKVCANQSGYPNESGVNYRDGYVLDVGE